MRYRAKLREDRSHRSGDMTNFDFSKWRPCSILDLFYCCLDQPGRVLGGVCDRAKFGCNRRSDFDSMPVLILCALTLKLLIHAPGKCFFWRILPPKWGTV